MTILTADLYTLVSVLRIHYAAPVLALLLAILWTPRSRTWLEQRIGEGPCAFITGMISAALVCIIGILGWHIAGVAVSDGSGASTPGADEGGPSQLETTLRWLESNFRSIEGLHAYYYVPWLTVLLVFVYCLLDRVDSLSTSRSTFRKVFFWTVVPIALLAAGMVSILNGFQLGFLLSLVILGGLIAVASLQTVWRDSAVFVKGMTTALFLILAGLATLQYFNFAEWRYGFFNGYEFYHYYIGSKYAPEVGYMGMYEASLIADDETGLKYNNSKGGIRNLTTGRYYATREETLERADEIKGWFSEARWKEFKDDIEFFKRKLVTGRWNGVLRDKGYNATPVWTAIVGGGLSNIVSTDNEQGMYLLAMLDVFLIIAATLCVMWAFGPNAALMMLIVLGTSYVMKYSHMKGAYLRTDFTMSIIIAICLIKKDCYRLAGAFTAYSIMSRVFPAALLFGIGAKFFWDVFPTIWRAPMSAFRSETPKTNWVAAFLGGLCFLVFYAALPIFALRAALPDFYTEHQADVLAVALIAAPVLAYFSITSLWGLATGTVKRSYAWYFLSVAITLVALFCVSLVYAALTPGYEKYARELRASNPQISDNMLRLRFVGRYWEEYGLKIGRHNEDISPWRVGFKYLFINQWSEGESPWMQAWSFVNDQSVADDETTDAAINVEKRAGLGSTLDRSWDALNQNNRTPRENIEAALKKNKPFTRSIRWNDKTEANAYKGLTLYQWRWIIPLSVIALSLFLLIGLKDYEAFAYSFVIVFFLASATYYYYIMLLIPLLFFSPSIGRPSRALGAAMIIFFAMPGYYLYSKMGWQQQFPTYYYHSLMYGILCVYMMLCAGGDTVGFLSKRIWRLAGGEPPAEEDVSPPEPDPIPDDLPPPPRFHKQHTGEDASSEAASNLLERLDETPIESGPEVVTQEPLETIEDTAIIVDDDVESYVPPVESPLEALEETPIDSSNEIISDQPLQEVEETPIASDDDSEESYEPPTVPELNDTDEPSPFELPDRDESIDRPKDDPNS